MNRTTRIPLAIAAATLMTACQATPPAQNAEANLPDAGPDGEYTVSFPEPEPGEARYLNMTVSEDVSSWCPMEPHFAFDEATPRPQDEVLMSLLARCLNSPKIVDNEVLLTGRTDRRGTNAYNQRLARERAQTVKGLLVKHGVDEERIVIRVRGERGAQEGDGLHSHGFDRRVDVTLLGDVKTPMASSVEPTLNPNTR